MIQICVGFFSLLCGLAVLVVGHLHPLTARPSPHFTLARIAVSVTAAHNHLLREGAVNNWKAVGTTLPSSGQLVGQLGLVERLVHLPECASWTPALHVACRRCRSEFFGEKKKTRAVTAKKGRKLHLLQFAEVPVGDTIIPTHWLSLPTMKISQNISKPEKYLKIILAFTPFLGSSSCCKSWSYRGISSAAPGRSKIV